MSTATTTELKAKIGPALGRVASGVFIVTVGHGETKDGMMASWVSQAGFEPPSLVVAVNKSRPIMKALEVGATFAVNVLSKRNMDIFKAFAKHHNEIKFDGLELLDSVAEAPAFKEAVSYMVLKVKSVSDASDHVLVLGEIVDGALLHNEDEPMVHLRRDGFQY
ncbi:MAG: flavin reductase [Cyanobacteria bacterium SZAS LIN-2]|nr:flavin reductase [Cyanobacteria bacterium SZAS LIN-3]MBS1998401.1 flavin reductase [Cyanobacteria bacterium SZAS LIN-2]